MFGPIGLRLLRSIVLLAFVSFLAYWFLRSGPNEPLATMVDSTARVSREDVTHLRSAYGLDLPIPMGYFPWAMRVVQGDLGQIVTTEGGNTGQRFGLQLDPGPPTPARRAAPTPTRGATPGDGEPRVTPIAEFLAPRAANTLVLVFAALLYGVVAVVAFRVLSVGGRIASISRVGDALSIVGASSVPFVLGLLLVLLFSIRLHVLPPGGIGSAETPPGLLNQLGDRALFLVMPAVVLAFTELTMLVRFAHFRRALASSWDGPDNDLEPHVGLIRSALLDAVRYLVDILGSGIGKILAATVIVEAVFSYPGLGKLLYDALTQNSFVVAVAIVLLLVVIALGAGIVAAVADWLVRPWTPASARAPGYDLGAPREPQADAASTAPGGATGYPAAPPARPATVGRVFAAIGLTFVVLLIGFAFLGPALSPYDPDRENLRERFTRPSLASTVDGAGRTIMAHPLGTDDLGRDTMTRMMHGARVSLAIGLVVAIVGFTLSQAIGIALAAIPWGAEAVRWPQDLQRALPDLAILMFVVKAVGPGLSVWLALAGLMFLAIERIPRGVRRGTTTALVVLASLHAVWAIRAEAALSYLGLGLQLPMPSLGSMLIQAQQYYFSAPWLFLSPALVLFIVLLSFHLVADGLRRSTTP
ncbi:MAG: hypothetical protein GEU73_03695 [Chloroflexi bacterium]|nr:hypothetical protein [Chloroflexota bacterium]